MRRALFAIPPLVTALGLGLVAPPDIAFVIGEVRQHRLLVIATTTAPVPVAGRMLHTSSVREPTSYGQLTHSSVPSVNT